MAPAPSGPPDPNGLGVAATRLGNSPRKQGRIALTVAGAVLDDGEMVEAVVVGKLAGNPAALVLTDRALRLVDEQLWRPANERFDLGPSLQVQGWQDERTASLTLVLPDRQVVVDAIVDRPLAVEMAQRIRARAGA